MAFDVDGARKAGYSDDEIAGFLSEQSGFDLAGARAAGYAPADVIGFLSTAAKPEPADKLNLGDPMGTGGSEIMAAAAPPSAGIVEQVARPNMLQQGFVDTVRNEVIGSLPAEKRLPALKELARAPGAYGIAAREILGDVEQENAYYVGKEANERQARKINASTPVPAAGRPRMAEGGRAAIVDATPGFADMARGDDEAAVAKTKTTAGILSAAQEGARKERQTTEARLQQPRTAEEWISDSGVYGKQGWALLRQVIANSVDPSSEWSAAINAEMKGLDAELTEKERFRREEVALRVSGTDSEIRRFAIVLAEMANPTIGAQEIIKQLPLMASIMGLTIAGGVTGGLVVRGASAAFPTVALADAIGGGGITAAGKLAGGLVASRFGAGVAAGGDAAQGVYEELTSAKNRPLMLQNPDVLSRIGRGMSEDQAIKEVATNRARIAQGLAGAVGAALGGMGLEGQVARKVAGKATGDGAAKAFGKELSSELTDELSTQAATNWQVGQVDPSRKLTEGSGETAATTFVTTLPMAATSAVMGHQETNANPVDQAIAASRLSASGVEFGATRANEFFRSDADVGPAPRPQGARPVGDPVAAIQAAPTVDDAIRTAAQAVDQTIDETQNAGAAAAVDNIARILGTESTNVGSPAAVPGVAAPGGGAGAVDAAAGVGAGVGTAGVVRPAVDAGSVGGQASGDAVPLGAGQPGALSFAPRSAGPVQQITVTPAGTVTAVGDPQALMRLLKAAGVTSVIPSKDGITVGKSQATMARKILDDFVAAPPASPPVVGAKAQADGDVVLQNRNRSTPSSIAQMRSIAAAPDYGRLGFSRDFANGAPVISGGKIPDAQVGRSDVAVASDGRRIPVRYAVVEADSVLASNSADGLANPDYGRQDLDVPRAIAGNGRIAGLQAAHANGQASAYVAELAQDNLHGIDPEVIRGMRSPVLVRVMPKEAITADIGDVSNTTGNLDLSAVESARNDAARINLEALQFSEDGALTPEAVRQFVRAMPQAEQGALVDTNGQPTRQAVDRLNAAVFFKAYGNDELVRLYAQAQDPEARLIMSALAQVAPAMARLEGAGDLDVRPVLTDAAKIAVNARRDGVSIKVAAKQLDLDADPGVSVFLDLFAANSRSVRPVVEALARVADFAYTEASKPAEDMLGDVPRASRSDVLNQIKGQPDEASNDQQAKRVADAPGRDGAPAADSGQGADARAAQGSAARGEGQARGQEGEGVGGESLDSRQVRGSGAANPAPQAGRAPGNAGAAAGDSGNRRGNPEGARNDRPQDLLGEAPNASQQEAARLRAEREAQQRRQQQQAPDAADFQMSGSDRAVDVGAAAGQRDLLAGAPDAGLSAADTQTVVATFRANGLDITVADTQDDLPESAQRRMLSEGISGVRGLYDPATDTTWIVRSNLGSKEEAFFVGLHEAFHRGLARTFGRDINAILGYIELNNKSVRDKAREYRIQFAKQALAEDAANWAEQTGRPASEFDGKLEDYIAKQNRYEAIEEVLADMAGEGKASDLRGWDRLLAFLRQVIQSMARGIGVNIPVTDAMVEQLVAGIRKEGMRDTPAFVVQSNKGPMFLRVFHGTPHTVYKFSTDKIGTGEGAQAYGWGLYFAGRREVAEFYKKKLTDHDRGDAALWEFNGKRVTLNEWIREAGSRHPELAQTEAKDAAFLASQFVAGNRDTPPRSKLEGTAMGRAIMSDMAGLKQVEGNLYEVNIPEDGEYLLWDKPLSEQPEGVRKALTSDTATMAALEEDQFGGPVMDQVTGRDFYRKLSTRLAAPLRENDKAANDEAASKALRAAGIRGIKYLDGSSRNTGDGSYNYVIFDDADVEIAARFSRQSDQTDARMSELADRTPSETGLDTEPDRALEPWRVNLAPALATAMRRWEAGRATDADLAAAVRAELDNRKAKREEATDRDRVRGADWLKERILRARRTGEMSTAEADLALWLLNRAPQVATDLGISIKSGDMTKPNGTYNVLARVVTSFTSKSNPNTLTHEILHHTERMMPEPVQNAIRKEWLKQLETEGKKVRTGLEQRIAQAEADPRLKRAVAADQQRIVLLDWMLEAARKGDADLASSLYGGFRDGISLRNVLPYKLSSPSEFWAVNAASLVRKRAETGTSLWRQARQWLSELVQKAKSLLGLRSNAPVIRGLEAVLAGDGSFVSRGMISTGARELNDQTDTPEFRRWFGDSKVVDAEGKPLVVYHGTASDFDAFQMDAPLRNKVRVLATWAASKIDGSYSTRRAKEKATAFFTSDPALASDYAASFGDAAAQVVMPTYLSLQRPVVMDFTTGVLTKPDGSTFDIGRIADAAVFSNEALIDIARQSRADGVVMRGVRDDAPNGAKRGSGDVFIVFSPEQIKSAIGNRGTFDPANPNIMFARATANPTQAGTPAALTPQTSPWRDETGRLRFLPGAWLYEKFGPEVGGAVMGGATGAAAGPVGAVVGAVAGAASARLMLNRLELKAASPALRRALREMKIQVAKAQETAAAVATEAMKLTEAERGMVSDLIEQEMAAGTVPPQHAVRLAAMINTTMGAQTDELVRLGMLSSESADMWRGKYLPRFYESKLRNSETMGAWADALRQLTGRPKTMAGIKGKHLRGRGMYETIPEAELPQWEQMGWEVRDPDYQPGLTEDGTVQVWRDFTRQERDSMGEIRDAGLRFVMGYMQTQRDIALGRMFEALAADPAMSSRRETEEFSVMVPDSTVPGTGAKRYGKLAGRWVSKDTLSHLSAIEEAQSEVWRMYRKAMAIWKESKTVLNPVSHVNNVVSNLTMAHLAGVSYLRADKYIGAARDFATNAPGIQEAKDAGLFLGTMSDAELMQVLPEDLKALVRKQDSTATKVGRSAFNVMTFFLRRPMGWAYQAEDTFFRYLIYKDARERGLEPADAVDYAQKYIFTYDDLPKGARMIRDFGIPFFSYTFKAVPALLHTAMTHPLRMAMPAALLWAANAAAYAIAFGGDDDDSWEESLKKYLTDGDFRNKVRQKEKLEREHLPPWMKGTTALLTPKTVRLGMDEVTKLPVFIDVSRIIPGGDLFDVSPNAGGIPLPQPVTPSHPLFTTAVAMLGNKDLFFGKELVDANDTRGEATLKRMDWMWKQMTPAIALGNYHFERGMNALAQATGEEIRWMPEAIAPDAVVTGIGRDGLPVQPRYAAMQTFGIKARPIDLEMAEDIGEGQKNKMLREIDAEIRQLQRQNMKGAVADSVMNRKRDQAQVKKDRIRDNLTVDGEEKP